MRRVLTAILMVALVGSLVLVGTGASNAGTRSVLRVRQFTATGDLGRYYTKQTVTGTYKNARGRPLDVTVYDWQNQALVFSARPKLDLAYWGGYWHDTYGFDQWYVEQNATAVFHLMLPPPPMGSTFDALLVTDFKGDGNWQNWMAGTSQ